MGYYRGQASAMLLDSQQHGPEAELLLVEGESAAQSVAAVRQSLRQAVLPLQGKPLNAWRASERKVAESPLFGQLAQALESGGLDVQQFVYRGLGSLPQQVLFDTCVQAGTRHAHVVRETDLRAVIEMFGGV